MIVDGTGLLHRAYHVHEELCTAAGHPTGCTYGMRDALISMLGRDCPSHLAVVHDTEIDPGLKHRRQMYPDYKANREPRDAKIAAQVPDCAALVKALGGHWIESGSWEADDVIASLARNAAAAQMPALVISSDKDLLCLTALPGVKVARPGKEAVVGYMQVTEMFGFPPDLMPTYQALCGDAIDNVPGVRGVGPVYARKLVQTYGSLSNILDATQQNPGQVVHATSVPPRVVARIAENAAHAHLMYELVRLHDVAVPALDALRRVPPPRALLRDLFEALEFQPLTPGEATSVWTLPLL